MMLYYFEIKIGPRWCHMPSAHTTDYVTACNRLVSMAGGKFSRRVRLTAHPMTGK